MKHEITTNKLRSLPVQLTETAAGVLLKRGCTELQVEGEDAARVVHTLLAAASGAGAVREDLAELFAAPDRPAVEELVQRLVERRILVTGDQAPAPPGEETRRDVFYWDLSRPRGEVERRLGEWEIVILGVNAVSRRMAASLADAGHPGVTVVDVPMLRNLELFPGDDGPDAEAWAGLAPPVAYAEWQEWFEPAERQCLVAASDFGGLSLLRDWNRFCLENETHFFPVVLQDLLGWVGPLVIPGETPCFECFLARRASHLAAPGVARAAELAAYAGQAVASFHPAAAGMLGELAAMELLKLYGGRLPGWRAGQVLELQVLVPALAARPVLRVPRCPACSGLNARSSAAADRFVLDAPSLDA